MMRDEIFEFESFIKLMGDLILMGSLDHKDFGALHPQFWMARTANDFALLTFAVNLSKNSNTAAYSHWSVYVSRREHSCMCMKK